MNVASLRPNPKNPRKDFTPEQLAAFRASVEEFGDLSGVVRNVKTDQLVGGHKRVREFQEDAEAKVVVTERLKKPDRVGTVAYGYVESKGTRWSYREVKWTAAKESAANLAANQHGAEFDLPMVADMLRGIESAFDLTITGFDQPTIDSLLNPQTVDPAQARATLMQRFGVPPFSVLDARQGYWQDRKRAWIGLGIQSELGRGGAGFDECAKR